MSTEPTGNKNDEGKPRLELIPREFLHGLGEVLRFGANKYADDNWRGGIVYRRLIGATLRHVTAFADGEDNDPESGLSHLHHAGCCLAFLSHFVATGREDLDDRYKLEETKE